MRRRDPVLEAALDRVVDEDLLGHREARSRVVIDAAVAVDLARRDAREPLVQARWIAGQLPHLGGRAADADLMADRTESHVARRR